MTHHRPAVFLDRDGTIIEDRGDLSDSSQVVFFDDTFESLRMLQEHFALFIVTNQSGISKGNITLQDAEMVNAHVVSSLARAGVKIEQVYVCPHQRADECQCIKPRPFFLRQAGKEYAIDLEHSYAIGDHPHDVEFAESAGARGIYVLSGHGQKHRRELHEGVVVVPGIAQAAQMILEALSAGKKNRGGNLCDT